VSIEASVHNKECPTKWGWTKCSSLCWLQYCTASDKSWAWAWRPGNEARWTNHSNQIRPYLELACTNMFIAYTLVRNLNTIIALNFNHSSNSPMPYMVKNGGFKCLLRTSFPIIGHSLSLWASSWFHSGLPHLCLHHVVSLFPHSADETADVHNAFLLDLVETVVDGKYCT